MKNASENADMIRFGKRIVELRANKNVTQEELAAKMGVSRVFMGYNERVIQRPLALGSAQTKKPPYFFGWLVFLFASIQHGYAY